MTILLSDLQAGQVANLTATHKAQANREAARLAALVALYYQTRVDVTNPESIERWLGLMIPRLITASDSGAIRSAAFFQAIRDIEVGRRDYTATPTLGSVDEGVRKSLLTVGPYDMTNKMSKIQDLDLSPEQQRALATQAKRVTTKKVAAAVVRHVQAGGRDTIIDNSRADTTALGWVRVTRANPCFFCAMLASRGITYRSFTEGAFDMSDARFDGEGDAKVHDQCGCSMKAVYSNNDPLLEKTSKFADQWSRWGAGGGDAALRFRRGYEHLQKTGEYLSFDEANEGLRAA